MEEYRPVRGKCNVWITVNCIKEEEKHCHEEECKECNVWITVNCCKKEEKPCY